ncbi:MAG: hypothetical protein ACLGHN_04860 [Bacteriovoracia bacterium]
MLKNVFLLGLLAWVSVSYAKEKDHTVVHDSMADAEAYKVEKATPEQEAKRAVAGGKIKKKKSQKVTDEGVKPESSETDSEVRYWQYSE